MRSGGNNFNYFPENKPDQIGKFCAVYTNVYVLSGGLGAWALCAPLGYAAESIMADDKTRAAACRRPHSSETVRPIVLLLTLFGKTENCSTSTHVRCYNEPGIHGL